MPDNVDIYTKIRKLAEENFKFKEQLEKVPIISCQTLSF